jgi:hypothetical protein
MSPLRSPILGYGKIARDRHRPAIAATEGVVLSATDPNGRLVSAAKCSICIGGQGAGTVPVIAVFPSAALYELLDEAEP